MSVRSTDAAPVGRTGWDVLAGNRLTILLIAAVVAVAAVLLLCPEVAASVGELWDEHNGYLVPVVLGLWFGRHLYFRYIRSIVVVQVEDLEHNVQAEYEISRQFFERLNVRAGLLLPVSTASGAPLYRVKSIDFAAGTIEAGWCHSPDTDIAAVLLVRSRWDALVRHDHDMTVRAESLAVMGYQDAYRHAQDLSRRLLDSLDLDSPEFEDPCDSGAPEPSEPGGVTVAYGAQD